MAGSPPATVYPQGRGVGAPIAAAGGPGRGGERPPRIRDGQKHRDGAIGAAGLDAANRRFLPGIFPGIFHGVGETLAVTGGEI
jgi:hypothetical protein